MMRITDKRFLGLRLLLMAVIVDCVSNVNDAESAVITVHRINMIPFIQTNEKLFCSFKSISSVFKWISGWL